MGWPLWRLGDVAEVVGGSTPKTEVDEYWGGGIPWATPADLAKLDGPFISQSPRTISSLGLAKSGAKLLPVGSVLLSSRAPIGHVAINTVPMATNQGFKSLIPDTRRLDPMFLYWWLRANKVSLQEMGVGATFKEVSKAIVSEVVIPLPPLSEQRRIASILNSVRDVLASREASRRKAERLLEADFVARFGDVVQNDRGWHMGTVADLVANFSSGKSIVGADGDAEADFRVLKVSAVTRGVFDSCETKPLPTEYTPPQAHLVQNGDLLISRANTADLVGATALVDEAISNVALPDKIWRFNWRADAGSPSAYVWRAFLRPEFRRALTGIATGSGGSMKNISQEAVLRLPLAIPPISARDGYGQFLAQFRALQLVHKAHMTELDELFASLQYRAFRGEL